VSLVGSLQGVQANPEPCNSNSNSIRYVADVFGKGWSRSMVVGNCLCVYVLTSYKHWYGSSILAIA
jgi:hypothetical protein